MKRHLSDVLQSSTVEAVLLSTSLDRLTRICTLMSIYFNCAWCSFSSWWIHFWAKMLYLGLRKLTCLLTEANTPITRDSLEQFVEQSHYWFTIIWKWGRHNYANGQCRILSNDDKQLQQFIPALYGIAVNGVWFPQNGGTCSTPPARIDLLRQSNPTRNIYNWHLQLGLQPSEWRYLQFNVAS